MFGLHSLLESVKKGTRLPLRKGGSLGQIPPAVDFPLAPLMYPPTVSVVDFKTPAIYYYSEGNISKELKETI